jgi:hypothetical protein
MYAVGRETTCSVSTKGMSVEFANDGKPSA